MKTVGEILAMLRDAADRARPPEAKPGAPAAPPDDGLQRVEVRVPPRVAAMLVKMAEEGGGAFLELNVGSGFHDGAGRFMTRVQLGPLETALDSKHARGWAEALMESADRCDTENGRFVARGVS